MFRKSLAALPLACALSVQAAGPYVTDDAAIAAPGACQLEAWNRWNRQGYDAYALPACNIAGRLEGTLGAYQQEDGAGAEARHILLQGKAIFREFAAHAFGFGAAAGVVWHQDPGPAQGSFSQAYAYVPATLLLEAASTQLHFNFGALHSEDLSRQFATWAAGAETALNERAAMNLEFYGDHHGEPSAQAGATFYLIPDRLTLFALAGVQHRNDSGTGRWATLGFAVSGTLFHP